MHVQLNELVLGNVEGTLAVFKGSDSRKPWRLARGLGTVSCDNKTVCYAYASNVLTCTTNRLTITINHSCVCI